MLFALCLSDMSILNYVCMKATPQENGIFTPSVNMASSTPSAIEVSSSKREVEAIGSTEEAVGTTCMFIYTIAENVSLAYRRADVRHGRYTGRSFLIKCPEELAKLLWGS